MAEVTKTEETEITSQWPEPNEHGLVALGDTYFDRNAVQLLTTEYTPDEIVAGLKESSNVRAWVKMINQTHLERRHIGRLVVAGTPTQPIVTGHRLTNWERRG